MSDDEILEILALRADNEGIMAALGALARRVLELEERLSNGSSEEPHTQRSGDHPGLCPYPCAECDEATAPYEPHADPSAAEPAGEAPAGALSAREAGGNAGPGSSDGGPAARGDRGAGEGPDSASG